MACTLSASELFNFVLKFLSTSASLAGILLILKTAAGTAAGDFISEQLRSYFAYFFDYLITRPCAKVTLLINEFIIRRRTKLTLIINKPNCPSINEVYDAACLYLPTRISSGTKRLRLSKTEKQKDFAISIEDNGEIVDDFQGIKLNWRYKCIQRSPTISPGQELISVVAPPLDKFFELSFDYKFKDKIINSYLPHVLAEANQIKKDTKVIKIYNCGRETGLPLRSINLEHPATFDTVVMDPELKKMIIDDLERFVKRREFYKKVGKAWKRGYLLYGPPGTGKSSLIAAMANHLKFDIYDLELASISSNSSLKNLLLSITNQSIVVMEDIDCSIKVPDRTNKLEHSSSEERLTLSGILNFIDGLWSSSADGKIIVFTTNDRDSLDPALLRPGRMDMHISFSYCTPCGFRLLAENYIGIKDHELFGEIEEAIRTMEVTPAEVAEQLMRNNNDPDALLNDLIQFLKVKKRENEEAKAKKNRAQQESTASEGGQTEEEEIEQK